MSSRLLKADLHSHTYYSPDALTSPGQFVASCLKRNINCVAVTEHNSIAGALAMQRLAPFKIIVGEEIRTQAGEVIGLFLKEEIARGLPLRETVERIKAQGGLVSVPHPFDRFRFGLNEEGLLEVLPYIDLMEAFNARNTFPGDNAKARVFAREHGIPAIAVSDAHSAGELGRSYIEMPDFNDSEEFLRAVRQARLIKRHASPLVHLLSRWAVLKRKLLGWQPVGSANA
ncbi:MAG TPA: PHP domain-containing protein [Dehalococcoidia bacterium]|nr:PHP domain-containing protein [Dehalococcoidia bacterium]